jgi:putative peptidoglycan lipid II flippase
VKNQASYLAAGALSYLQYGRTLMKVPIGVFGMAAGVASYPTVSRMVAAGDVVEAYRVLSRAVRLMLVAILGAQVCLTLAGFEAVYVIWGLFGSRFTAADAQATSDVLVFLSLGLGGWAAQTVISRGFYALGSTWLPTLVGTGITIAMIPLYVVLRMHFGADGLAVASSIAILVYVFLLGWLQRRRFDREAAERGTSLSGVPGMLSAALRLAGAAAIAMGIGWAIRLALLTVLPGVDAVSLLVRGTVLCGVGLGIYALAARLFGVSELADLAAMLTRRLRRKKA